MKDKIIFKRFSALLLLLMVVRHWQFYFPTELVLREFGFLQPILGMLLIPVTVSFGFLAFWGRNSGALSRNRAIKLFGIFIVPLVLAAYHGDIWSVISYGVYDFGRRPSFLILVPIVFSIYASSLSTVPRGLIVGVLGISVFTISNVSFVLYYSLMFVVFAFISHFICKISRYRFVFLSSITVQIVCFIALKSCSIERLGFLMEFVWGVSYISSLYYVVHKFWGSESTTVFDDKILRRLNVFSFYLSQAIYYFLILLTL